MQILNHSLLTEALSFRHTGWHSTQLLLHTRAKTVPMQLTARACVLTRARSSSGLVWGSRFWGQEKKCRSPVLPAAVHPNSATQTEHPGHRRAAPARAGTNPSGSRAPEPGALLQPRSRRFRSPAVPAAQKYPCGGRAAPSLVPRIIRGAETDPASCRCLCSAGVQSDGGCARQRPRGWPNQHCEPALLHPP